MLLLEAIGLALNLGTISTKYIEKLFSNSIAEITTFSFSIKAILFLVATLFPKKRC